MDESRDTRKIRLVAPGQIGNERADFVVAGLNRNRGGDSSKTPAPASKAHSSVRRALVR